MKKKPKAKKKLTAITNKGKIVPVVKKIEFDEDKESLIRGHDVIMENMSLSVPTEKLLINTDLKIIYGRKYLGTIGLRGSLHNNKIGTLSVGQKSRVLMNMMEQ